MQTKIISKIKQNELESLYNRRHKVNEMEEYVYNFFIQQKFISKIFAQPQRQHTFFDCIAPSYSVFYCIYLLSPPSHITPSLL